MATFIPLLFLAILRKYKKNYLQQSEYSYRYNDLNHIVDDENLWKIEEIFKNRYCREILNKIIASNAKQNVNK